MGKKTIGVLMVVWIALSLLQLALELKIEMLERKEEKEKEYVINQQNRNH